MDVLLKKDVKVFHLEIEKYLKQHSFFGLKHKKIDL